MSLHGLLSVTIGVPNVDETAAYYTEFGLAPGADGWLSTADAGRQLRILPAPTRRLLALRVGADDADDLARAAAGLARLGVRHELRGTHLAATEPVTGVRVGLDVVPRLGQPPVPGTAYNGPGRLDRPDCRAPGFTGPDRVRPRKLGHAVLGSTDYRDHVPSSPTGSGSRSATGSRAWARSCAAPPTTTTCWSWPRR